MKVHFVVRNERNDLNITNFIVLVLKSCVSLNFCRSFEIHLSFLFIKDFHLKFVTLEKFIGFFVKDAKNLLRIFLGQ